MELRSSSSKLEEPSEILNLNLFQKRSVNCVLIKKTSFSTFTPYLKAAGEVKTKPTQHSVWQLQSLGIFPDLILCRLENLLEEKAKEKIALFCNMPKKAVLTQVDVKGSIYALPLSMVKQKLDVQLSTLLGLKYKKPNLSFWKRMVENDLNPKQTVKICLVGKYTYHSDAYKSILEALHHAAIAHQAALQMVNYDSENIENLEGCDEYLIPIGFRNQGFEGKIATATCCRINHIPCFGICIGMQAIVIKFARSVLGLTNANSIEMDSNTPHPVISLLENQNEGQNLGGRCA